MASSSPLANDRQRGSESPTIRPARPDEADAVRQLVQNAYAHYVPRLGLRPGPMDDDYARRIAAGQVWVVDAGDAIAGIVVLEEQPDALLLDNVAVAPAARSRGIGRALIAFAEREAMCRGFSVLRLYTHERMVENIALYQRLGFVETDRVQEKGFARLYMEKRRPA
jgi:ribosomal protein S18 acetylase RimI-like enzyme